MTQSEFYLKMMDYSLTDECEMGCDYFKVAEIEDILYYAPNNEEWGAIVAVSHEHELAHDTGFYEMDDMAAEHGEYKQVVDNDEIKCEFEV